MKRTPMKSSKEILKSLLPQFFLEASPYDAPTNVGKEKGAASVCSKATYIENINEFLTFCNPYV